MSLRQGAGGVIVGGVVIEFTRQYLDQPSSPPTQLRCKLLPKEVHWVRIGIVRKTSRGTSIAPISLLGSHRRPPCCVYEFISRCIMELHLPSLQEK